MMNLLWIIPVTFALGCYVGSACTKASRKIDSYASFNAESEPTINYERLPMTKGGEENPGTKVFRADEDNLQKRAIESLAGTDSPFAAGLAMEINQGMVRRASDDLHPGRPCGMSCWFPDGHRSV